MRACGASASGHGVRGGLCRGERTLQVVASSIALDKIPADRNHTIAAPARAQLPDEAATLECGAPAEAR